MINYLNDMSINDPADFARNCALWLDDSTVEDNCTLLSVDTSEGLLTYNRTENAVLKEKTIALNLVREVSFDA